MLFARTVSFWIAITSPNCQLNRPGSVLLSMDLRDCYSQVIPRSPVHHDQAIGDLGPTWRFSRNRGEGPAGVPGHRVEVRAVLLHKCLPPRPSHPILRQGGRFCGIATIAKGNHIFGTILYFLQQQIEGDAFPMGIQFSNALVTQWMSLVIGSCGNARNSSQLQCFALSTSPSREKSHFSSGVCGVGPAERTGKPCSRYCPGGILPLTSLF